MHRSASQEVMDAARGDPEGHRRSAAWEEYSARQGEDNAQGWPPMGPRSVVMGDRVTIPSFPIAPADNPFRRKP